MKARIKLQRMLLSSGACVIVNLCGVPGSVCAAADPLDTWTQRWASSVTFQLTGIASGNGLFVATAPNTFGGLLISSDGTAWTQFITPPVLNYAGLTFGKGTFITFGPPVNSSGTNLVLRSADGLNWSKIYETTAP